jgi:hypothetical protein
MEYLQLLDGRGTNWRSPLAEAAESKKNFLLVLDRPEQLSEACALAKAVERTPERLSRWGVNALLDALREGDQTKLLELSSHCAVYLFEQLYLAWNVPPKVHPFIVYCEVRGIISDHEDPAAALESLLTYVESFHRARLLPLAGLYRFEHGRWIKHRGTSVP